jgi:diguanylate cyclase (GGDEF)-like protein
MLERGDGQSLNAAGVSLDWLAQTALFCELAPDLLDRYLRQCTCYQMVGGEVLLSPERDNHQLFLMLNGRLSVHLLAPDHPPLAYLEAGDCVGEISLLDRQKPSAYVVAMGRAEVLAMSDRVLWAFIAEAPRLARNLLQILAGRTRYNHAMILTQEQYANVDLLTGLHNRRRLYYLFDRAYRRCQKGGHPLTLLVADIDHFKRFNDCYGHLAGDQVLCAVAHTLDGNLRPQDVVARYGGEEFVILLPETGLPAALAIAERVRREVARTAIGEGTLQALPPVTISLGVAVALATDSFETLMARADAALYRAKSQGRNCVSE